MLVKWIPLNLTEARGFVSHYTITYSPQTSGRKRISSSTLTKIVPGMDSNTTAVEDLDSDSEYGVAVSATNGAGTSDSSTTADVSLFIFVGMSVMRKILPLLGLSIQPAGLCGETYALERDIISLR